MDTQQRRTAAMAVIVVLTVSAAAMATPPGYRLIQVTDGSMFGGGPRVNNCGQVVFIGWEEEWSHGEVFMFDSATGTTTRITEDDVSDVNPDINDAGVVVWGTYDGDKNGNYTTYELALYRDGEVVRLTHDAISDVKPSINNLGHIAWCRWHSEHDPYYADIQFYDGETITTLTEDYSEHNAPSINDADEIAWTRYRMRDEYDSKQAILLWSGGQTVELTDDETSTARYPVINNSGQVAWYRNGEGEGHRLVEFWDGGDVRVAADYATSPQINAVGDLYFMQSNGDGKARAMASLHGTLVELDDRSELAGEGDINDRGDLVWASGPLHTPRVMMLKRLPRGDMNCDDAVDFDDIDGFVAALIGKDAFLETEPDCDWWLTDMNDDRSIDFNDIDPFVTCLVDGGCERK